MDKKIYAWGDSRRFNSYSAYFKRTFGSRVQKVTIDAGFTCPNRDGTKGVGGCTFCTNEAFIPSYCTPTKSVAQQIIEGQGFHKFRYKKAPKNLAYFQAYSNTYKPLSELKAIYDEALAQEDVIGIVVGTRPDCVDQEKLDYFAELAQNHYVILEFGVESCHNTTLERINRGHDFETSVRAIEMCARSGVNVGAHFILGLPGETPEMMIEQTKVINELPLNTIKFHQLQVFKGTLMAEEYLQNPDAFTFFEMEEYLELFSEVLARLNPNFVIERFAGEAPPRFHLGGSWGQIRNDQLIVLFEKLLEKKDYWQGCKL